MEPSSLCQTCITVPETTSRLRSLTKELAEMEEEVLRLEENSKARRRALLA
ncbi:unnamed protein product, partial [Laminaria digitata]